VANNTRITIPDFDFSGFYYPDIIRALTAFRRQNVTEITSEDDEEPYIQLERAFALVGHLNNVLLDIVATETLLPTARLLESVRSHLRLIDYILAQANPAQVEVVVELAKIFTTATNFIPADTQVATEETEGESQIIYESDTDNLIQPTDKLSSVFSYDVPYIEIANNVFDVGDNVAFLGVTFTPGVDFAIGATVNDTAENLVEAINASSNPAVEGRVFAYRIAAKVLLNLLDYTIPSIIVSKVDGVTTNFNIRSGGFSTNKAGEASITGVFFNMFNQAPEPGSLFYIGHESILWNTIDFTFNTFGSGIVGVWEYYDGEDQEKNPTTVTNLGSNLEFVLTDLLGTTDRTGALVRVTYTENGAYEDRPVFFSGGLNKIRTTGLLGQISVSVDPAFYLVGSDWNDLKNLSDATELFTKNGKIIFDLPQTISENWQKVSINAQSNYFLRFRVISVSTPVIPSVDRCRNDTGTQYLLFKATQGLSTSDVPLGSSNQSPFQEFTLSAKPVIPQFLVVEVDEGSGFTEWSRKENLLTSTPISKDYTLEIDADDEAVIKFGDGKTGKIPVSGVDNIRAFYKVGADVDGNVGAKTITVNKAGIAFVNRVFNPRPAAGWRAKEGSTDEDLARVKIQGPASLRVRNRAITPDDYEFLATQFTTSSGSVPVVRALTIEEVYGVKTLELVVVGVGGTLLPQSTLDELADFFNGNKAKKIKGVGLANHEATPVNYTPRYIDIEAVITGGNAEVISNALKALLNPEAKFSDGVTNRWDFEDLVPRAIIISAIIETDPQNVKNVNLISPPTDIQLTTKELPLVRNINLTIV
jgi:hypothetical protein